MVKPIINIDEVELQSPPPAHRPTGETAQRYESKMGFISPRLGAKKLGYNITELPPGKRAYPFHNHRINEEMFLILEGKGEVRIGADTYPVIKGDIIACPPGDKNKAHQIINSGSAPLKFLAVSTKLSPEVAEYPDSGKFAVLADFSETANDQSTIFRFVNKETNGLDYWEGE